MNPLKVNNVVLESKIRSDIIDHLTLRGWYIKIIHCGKHQKGLPDLFATHSSHGQKWLEVKRPEGYRFTDYQINVFTNFAKQNIGVWVMTSTKDYDCLFRDANWHSYLFKSRGVTKSKDQPLRKKSGPEGVIQDKIIQALTKLGWYCVETYGDLFQYGIPDLYCCHKTYGSRFIEVKNPTGYKFTPAQVLTFPKLSANGTGVWVLFSENEIDKIHQKENWYWFLK